MSTRKPRQNAEARAIAEAYALVSGKKSMGDVDTANPKDVQQFLQNVSHANKLNRVRVSQEDVAAANALLNMMYGNAPANLVHMKQTSHKK